MTRWNVGTTGPSPRHPLSARHSSVSLKPLAQLSEDSAGENGLAGRRGSQAGARTCPSSGSPSLRELRTTRRGALPPLKGPQLRGTECPSVPKPVYSLDRKLMDSSAPGEPRPQPLPLPTRSLVYLLVCICGSRKGPQAPDPTHSAHPLSLSLSGSLLGGESSRPARGLIP